MESTANTLLRQCCSVLFGHSFMIWEKLRSSDPVSSNWFRFPAWLFWMTYAERDLLAHNPWSINAKLRCSISIRGVVTHVLIVKEQLDNLISNGGIIHTHEFQLKGKENPRGIRNQLTTQQCSIVWYVWSSSLPPQVISLFFEKLFNFFSNTQDISFEEKCACTVMHPHACPPLSKRHHGLDISSSYWSNSCQSLRQDQYYPPRIAGEWLRLEIQSLSRPPWLYTAVISWAFCSP